MGSGGEAKVLYNVSIQNSSWAPLKVLMSPENTVRELTEAAIAMYVAREHRPLLASSDPASYELHRSQFHFESKFSNLVVLIFFF